MKCNCCGRTFEVGQTVSDWRNDKYTVTHVGGKTNQWGIIVDENVVELTVTDTGRYHRVLTCAEKLTILGDD